MTTKNLIRLIASEGLGKAFHEEICNIYQRDVAKGDFATEEQDYITAMEAFAAILSPEKSTLLAEYEKTCTEIREYSASYGFIAGLYCCFKQYFTSERIDDGGFSKYVSDDIALMPKMKRHISNYANIEHRNEIGESLADEMDEALHEHLVSIECAWSQRAHSASINGFYVGYRAALAILDKIEPFSCCSVVMSSKVLSMEHRLGYIKSFEEVERLQENAAGNTQNPTI